MWKVWIFRQKLHEQNVTDQCEKCEYSDKSCINKV